MDDPAALRLLLLLLLLALPPGVKAFYSRVVKDLKNPGMTCRNCKCCLRVSTVVPEDPGESRNKSNNNSTPIPEIQIDSYGFIRKS